MDKGKGDIPKGGISESNESRQKRHHDDEDETCTRPCAKRTGRNGQTNDRTFFPAESASSPPSKPAVSCASSKSTEMHTPKIFQPKPEEVNSDLLSPKQIATTKRFYEKLNLFFEYRFKHGHGLVPENHEQLGNWFVHSTSCLRCPLN